MIKKFLIIISNFLYKIHYKIYILLNDYLQDKKHFSPYILKKKYSKGTIRIVHVNGNFVVGGTTQLIVDIIENMSEKYAHEIIVPDYPEPLPYQPVNIHKYSIYELSKLYDFLKENPPAAIHIHYWVRYNSRHDSIALWYAAVFKICEELAIKVIQNVNVPTEPFDSSAVVCNIFVSKYVLDNFNTSKISCSVIYPGSNFNHFKNDSDSLLSNESIGMVYRLDKDKLNAEAIEIFISVVKKRPSIQCYIVGGGFYFDYYKQRVKEEGLERKIIFTGYVSYKALPDYYKKIGLLVAPVHDESFGQVTPFAMSMGLCVAGYDTGALSEILGSKETLVKYGDIDKLVDSIVSLMGDHRKRLAIGLSNRKRAHELFAVESMIVEYEKIYNTYV
ncbi:glycosyltransferase [Hymenobacter sp. UV11]|uniref:glycosyltransferase family 4 protein n=1 Tax=Hymenobacter sp. UV11 TaxID=1849735 RepID=UPI00106161F3|nr:glycosyltransferase family 4 protein [Hymenobacter sp. UV11]TFZ67415.1 glycosyltransferase [Hymenobacter sp. UV11]